MPHGAPGEQQVGQLLQGGPPLGDRLELVAVLLHVVECLDQQPAADALEVELADAQLVGIGLRRRDLDDLEAALRAQDLERLRRVAGRHDGLEEAGADGARRGVVDGPVGADDPAVRADAVALEGQPERLRQVDHAGQAARVAVLDDARPPGVLKSRRDAPRGVQVEQVVEERSLPAIWCAQLMLPPAWAGSV